MCDTCGCGEEGGQYQIKKVGQKGEEHQHQFDHEHPHHHDKEEHQHIHSHHYEHHHSEGESTHDHEHHHHDHSDHNHSHEREIVLQQNILQKNDLLAERNRGFFEAKNIPFCFIKKSVRIPPNLLSG